MVQPSRKIRAKMEGIMKDKTTLSKGLLVLALITFLAIVGPGDQASAAGKVAVDSWNIPEITILTGPGAAFGLDAAWGVDRAAGEINATGGISGVPIKISKYDTAYDTAKAIQVMTKALGKNPLVIIGPMDQSGAVASGHLAVKYGVPFISSLSGKEGRKKFSPWGSSLYSDFSESAQLGIVAWLKANPGVKSVAIFYVPTEPAIVAAVKKQEEILEKLGIPVRKKIEVSMGQLDLGPQVVKALASKADGFYSHLNVNEHATLCKAFKERGFSKRGRICAGAGATSGALFDLGKGAIEGTFIWDTYDFTNTSPRWLDYVKAYKADHKGAFPYSMAIHGQYEAVYAVKAAIEQTKATGAKSNRKAERRKIRDFLLNAKDLPSPDGKSYSYVNGGKPAQVILYKFGEDALKAVNGSS
jgi:ABC-type branched-subunit amino acid transport system substrate-binding protein